MARIIGIDLGSHTVKLAVFEGSFGRAQPDDLLTRPVRQDEIHGPDREARLDALAALLRGLEPDSNTTWVLGFPQDLTTLRTVQLPFADRAQVERTFRFEVENQVPFDLDRMVMAHRTQNVEEGDSRVLVALANQDDVQSALDGVADLGIDPRHLLVEGDVFDAYGEGQTVAVVDLGHMRTLVTLADDQLVLATRTIDGGGRALTQALSHAHEITWAEAEQRKHASSLDGPDGELLRTQLAPLLAALRATLIGFEDAHGVEIERVILAGGASGLGGLPALLEADLGVPVSLAEPLLPDHIMGSQPRAALASALATHASSRARALDLRQEGFAYRGDLTALRNLAKIAAIAAAAMLILGVGWFAYQMHALSAEKITLETDIATVVLEAFPDVDPGKLTSASMAFAIMQEKTIETTSRVDALGSIISDSPPTVTLLAEISKSMPAPTDARIDVSELSIGESTVTMKAETDGFEAATKIEAALQANERFKQARKGDEKKTRSGVRFTITIPLGDEQEEG